ncbi:MAG: hypothetical protein BGP06_09450 [Rhizobiales bacterium 65-9]|nr:MAG: hypothetical protein BGP06_09450 [Rhizobiales bacterium 65-9]
MSSLKAVIGAGSSHQQVDLFFNRFGLAKNPFPASRTIIDQVMYNQEAALQKFVGRVQEVVQADGPQRRAIGVVAGTGGGKTHFLRHCQFQMHEIDDRLDRPFVVVEVLAGSGSAVQVLREILNRADDVAKRLGEFDLVTAIVRKASKLGKFAHVKQIDLRSVLQLLNRASEPNFVPPDRNQLMKFDALRDLAKRWLGGATISASERNYLGVFSRLSSAALMTKVLSELLSIARQAGLLEGVFLCIDEMETLFLSGVSSSKVQAYLQDLRYLFDESSRAMEGYSLLVMSASTQNGAANLQNYNYPLYQRLGFEGDAKAELEPIKDLDEVRSFADKYIDYELRRVSKTGNVAAARMILDEGDLETAFKDAASTNRQFRSLKEVNQGQLLEALHNLVERKRIDLNT